MNIGWPEGILIGLMALSLTVHFLLDGEPKNERYQVFSFSNELAECLLLCILLYWGEFFS
jgi:hypothetical protein